MRISFDHGRGEQWERAHAGFGWQSLPLAGKFSNAESWDTDECRRTNLEIATELTWGLAIPAGFFSAGEANQVSSTVFECRKKTRSLFFGGQPALRNCRFRGRGKQMCKDLPSPVSLGRLRALGLWPDSKFAYMESSNGLNRKGRHADRHCMGTDSMLATVNPSPHSSRSAHRESQTPHPGGSLRGRTSEGRNFFKKSIDASAGFRRNSFTERNCSSDTVGSVGSDAGAVSNPQTMKTQSLLSPHGRGESGQPPQTSKGILK